MQLHGSSASLKKGRVQTPLQSIHCTALHVHVCVELSFKVIIVRHVMNGIASYASA